MVYKCECDGAIQPVAFNCDIEDKDLYDFICPKCGRHYVLAFEQIDIDTKEYKITVFVDEIEGYQLAKIVKRSGTIIDFVERMTIETISGTTLNRLIKYVNNPGKINPDGFGYIVR